MIKSIKNFICSLFNIKACKCKDVPPVPTHCVRCGDLFKDCACISPTL